jgi:hypothetical protein
VTNERSGKIEYPVLLLLEADSVVVHSFKVAYVGIVRYKVVMEFILL